MDSNLQSKLQQFSADPPEGAWRMIADSLDAEAGFPQRLYQYENEPPATVWQAVEQTLDEKAPAKVVPFATRFRKPLRYAAVACFIAVVLVIITLTSRRTEAGAADAGSNTTVPTHNKTATVQDKVIEQSNSKLPANPSQQSKAATASSASKNSAINPNDIAVASAQKAPAAKAINATYASSGDYVLFSDGDGQVRKVSKKLAQFVNCKDGDGNCKQRLQQLRAKMVTTAMTTDFTGILEMLHGLQQKP